MPAAQQTEPAFQKPSTGKKLDIRNIYTQCTITKLVALYCMVLSPAPDDSSRLLQNEGTYQTTESRIPEAHLNTSHAHTQWKFMNDTWHAEHEDLAAKQEIHTDFLRETLLEGSYSTYQVGKRGDIRMEWGPQQVRPASGSCPIVSFGINYLKHNVPPDLTLKTVFVFCMILIRMSSDYFIKQLVFVVEKQFFWDRKWFFKYYLDDFQAS
jgi:hypothetical protein